MASGLLSSVYVRQGPVPPFSRSKPVTKDEIQELKRLRLCLLDEKQQLVARIARARGQNKKGVAHNRTTDGHETPRGTERLCRELDRERQILDHLIAEQKRQIADLQLSDDAALCRELEEDAKVVFQERLRLEEYQAERRRALAQVQRDLEQLLAIDGPDVLPQLDDTVRALEAKLSKYSNANKKLERRIERLITERSSGEGDDVERRAQDLQRQIADVKAATDRNRAKFEDEKRKHEQVVARLREAVEAHED
jgi:hypothetical protein